jgi:hypothetical protein
MVKRNVSNEPVGPPIPPEVLLQLLASSRHVSSERRAYNAASICFRQRSHQFQYPTLQPATPLNQPTQASFNDLSVLFLRKEEGCRDPGTDFVADKDCEEVPF